MARSELLAAQEEIGRLKTYIEQRRKDLHQILFGVIGLACQLALLWVCGRGNTDTAILIGFVTWGASYELARLLAKKIMP